ncbi:MAG: amidohydrolase family protein [Candidatus Neomarinimicrobiota bacterium]
MFKYSLPFLLLLNPVFSTQNLNPEKCCGLPNNMIMGEDQDQIKPKNEEKEKDRDKNEENKWDVGGIHGAQDTLRFITKEGTWMSCDISPDGKQLVFDLLGDIYIMPIQGGAASVLTSGPAWDIQPVFDPEGKKIAFTSDRSGGDNIWVMDRDGSNPEQITDESFRLLNNPVFSADGKYIIARKHFVNTRSLGAGEMWIYHISGGKGRQITKRRNWQHDAGEPEVSPDGKYLYYSQDISAGETYKYNRDPYGSIYAIKRIDLLTGKTTTAVSGLGGSVTPQISPDGNTLAFVRRIGLKTGLFVKDLASGNERLLFDNLNRDAQETWAIFGLHPGFAWDPAGEFIIISAKGGFWKIGVKTAAVEHVPFTVKVEQILTAPVKIKNQAGGSAFSVKTVRHSRVSPDGKKVVYNALGQLYMANINGSNRKRLTNLKDGFEFSPAWSPDGKNIVFTTWQDQKSGRIGIVKAKGGTPAFIKIPPGHYFEPEWSPSGKQIVYRRGGGSWLRGFDNTAETGLYIYDLKLKTTRLILTKGREPVFNKTGKRIMYFDRDGENNALFSINLRGKDPQKLITSKYAETISLSPDEKWVAFEYRYHIYTAPYTRAAAALDISPKSDSVPVKKVTRDSGFGLHWSKNNTLCWTLGSELYQRKMEDLFDFLETAADSLPEPDSSGVQLGWNQSADIPANMIAITNARIITMGELGVIENGTIVVDGNRIKAVGPGTEITIPRQARVLNAAGKTIIPGLIDVHAHMGLNWDGITAQQNWGYLANLAFGVTTTHDPSKDTELVFANSELQKSGSILAPRIYSTGTILYGAVHSFTAEINSLEDAKTHLRRIKAFGGFSVKSYNQPRRNQRQQVLKAARDLGLLVYPEGGSTLQHNLNMIVDGHTGIEHSLPVSPLYNDVLTLYGKSGVGYTPTLIVSYGGIWGENYWYAETKVFEHEKLLAFTPKRLLDRKRRRMKVEDEDYNWMENARAANALAQAGVKVNNGAHGQLEGLGVHWEMWMLVQGGMSAMEALRASTINGAEYIGLGGDLGDLSPGKLADLVILEKNPLENIRNSEFVEMVMLNGRLYDSTTMNELLTGERKVKKLWWK